MERPHLKTFLLKVAARCNINCDYCYEYNLVDTSWRRKPAKMSKEVVDKTIERILEHVHEHNLKAITIIFHGGEPLLAGKEFFEYCIDRCGSMLASFCSIKYGMQSNGVLLDEDWAKFLKKSKLGVGVSVDGYKEINDRHRLDHKGNSTFDRVESALRLLSSEEYSSIKGGMLCVMQPDTDPIKLFEWFLSFGKTQIDFLFPLYNYERKPPYPFDEVIGYGFGVWLSKIFDYWWINDLSDVKVRIFEDLIHLMLGGKYAVESFGLAPVQLVVIQSDGEYEAVDSLKSSYDGAVSTKKNVYTHKLSSVLDEYLVASRLARFENLSESCQKCSQVKVCGGGYIPHRFSSTNGFKNPSIYCKDLMYLIHHISSRLMIDLDEESKLRIANTFAIDGVGNN